MADILILSGSHLCHNPRVIKEATALALAGHKVEVLGGWHDSTYKARDLDLSARVPFKFRALHDLTKEKATRVAFRARWRSASFVHDQLGLENHWQLGYFVSALAKAARLTKSDMIIAHSEPALWALAQTQTPQLHGHRPNFRCGVDMEDWFSEDLPPEVRRHRPIKLLRRLEQNLLRSIGHATCTSKAMSEALAREYGCPPPLVVYNAFPWSDRLEIDGKFKDRRNLALPSVHWYSQTMGMDRGLGELFAALPLIKQNFEIHLRGKPAAGFESWMVAKVPEHWRKHVFLHPLVANDELLSRIAEHDIGFAGEQKISRNRDLTITNKILHYLLGGLAVVASDTAGQREVADLAPGAVFLCQSGDPAGVAREFNTLLASPKILQEAKAAALLAAQRVFCWERQVPVLLNSLQTAIVN